MSDESPENPRGDEVARGIDETRVEEEGDSLESLLQSRGASGAGEGATFELEGEGGGDVEEPVEPWTADEVERAARATLKWGGKAGAAISMQDAALLLEFQVDRDILDEGSREIAEDVAPILNDVAPKGSGAGKALEKIVKYLGAATSVGMWGTAVGAQIAAEKKMREAEEAQQQAPEKPRPGEDDDEEGEG